MLEQKVQNFIDQIEQERDNGKIWKQSLENNLLKLINQNKEIKLLIKENTQVESEDKIT